MAEQSAISWTDATYNPWVGCTKISPACDHCYAARDNARFGWVAGWGTGVARKRTKTARDVRRWNREAATTGKSLRVFCASLADVFDNEVEQSRRDDLWQLLRETPNLRWILLTKRVGNAPKMLPPVEPPNEPARGSGLSAPVTAAVTGFGLALCMAAPPALYAAACCAVRPSAVTPARVLTGADEYPGA